MNGRDAVVSSSNTPWDGKRALMTPPEGAAAVPFGRELVVEDGPEEEDNNGVRFSLGCANPFGSVGDTLAADIKFMDPFEPDEAEAE